MRLGPKLKLTRPIIDAITRNLASLCSRKDAAWAEGVPERSLVRWMRRGRDTYEAYELADDGAGPEPELTADDQICYDLFLAVEQSQAKAKVHAAARVNAGKGGWQGSARALEWSSSDYARRERHEHSGPDGGPIQVKKTTEEALREVRRIYGLDEADEPDRGTS